MGDRLAECLTLVDVLLGVLEDGLAGAGSQCGPAQAGAADDLRVLLGAVGVGEVRATQEVGGRDADVLENHAAQGCGAQAHGRIGLDLEALGAGFDDDEGVHAVQLDGDDEELALRGVRDHGLHAVEDDVVALQLRGGLQLEGVEHRASLGDHDGCRRDGLAGEGRQVGLLLGVVTVVGDGVGHACRGEDGDGQAHVTEAESLGDEGVGAGAGCAGNALELLREVHESDAELSGSVEQPLGRLRLVVGLRGGRTQALDGELAHRVEDHLLVLGRIQVERCLARLELLNVALVLLREADRIAGALDALELAVHRAGGTDAALGGLVGSAVDGLVEVVLFCEVGTSETRQRPHNDTNGVTLDVVQPRGGVVELLGVAHCLVATFQ